MTISERSKYIYWNRASHTGTSWIIRATSGLHIWIFASLNKTTCAKFRASDLQMIIKSKLVTDCLDPVLVKFNDHFQIVRFVPKILEIWNFTIPEPNAILYWCSKVCKAGDRSSSEITRGEGSYCSDEASWKSTGNLDQWMRGKWQLVGGAITKLRSQCNMFRWAPKPLFAADYTSGAAIDPLFTCTSRELTCSQFLEMFHVT
ncbi:hypothetical protein RRG08_055424 [Elysia crispata]|uniref:Uncharacterized protein n=1 Tax=Elysia crispata TaxID=231223 RepID=A0AAE1ASY8_9GAST|nr:hypothetical protein RRG08_055424 [Elysia crispata]